MSARRELAGIMEQWLQLTQSEAVAIQKSLWPALKQIQARKADLRKSFAQAFQKCVQEDATHPAQPPFRREAARIMSLLNRNAAALAAQLKKARACQEKLDQTKRNLHRIRSSYARPSRPRAWNSYS